MLLLRQTKKKPKWRRGPSPLQRILGIGIICVLVIGLVMLLSLGRDKQKDLPSEETLQGNAATSPTEIDPEDPESAIQESESGIVSSIIEIIQSIKGVKETEDMTFGIDVAKYQGTIDWQQVAQSGVDFAIVRVGYRTQVSGEITADSNAKYNLQEAQKHGIKLGAYFFSTAVTKEEAVEEANWVADYISQYAITYPVVYNCEGYNDPENRQYSLTKTERTDIALAFLEAVESRGYEAMFYASRNEMEDDVLWEVSRIETDYKIWVAQYPEVPYPETESSSYSGIHHMWQYTRNGSVPGISQPTDLNVGYFGYDGTEKAQNQEPPEEAKPDVEALMSFREVNETVTAKEETNLRDKPGQDADSNVLYTLKNGEIATRTGISDSGWSRVVLNGNTYYAVSNYLTTDLNYTVPTQPEDEDGIETEFRSVNEPVTAKEKVNLRTIPSVTDGESEIIGQLLNGDIATRIGVSDNGWSKLEWNGNICYAVSSYLTTDVTGTETESDGDGVIDTVFTDVSESVTAKDVVNLRTMPSVTDPNSEIVTQLKNGEVINRTGINTDVGWSRVEYNGQVLYCVSSYLELAE